jgi:hypothetical protein
LQSPRELGVAGAALQPRDRTGPPSGSRRASSCPGNAPIRSAEAGRVGMHSITGFGVR